MPTWATSKPRANPDEKGDAGETKLGIVVREVSPATAAKLHIPGVVVQSVRSGSFADLQGLEPGLVIVRINKQPTGTKDQFDAVVASSNPATTWSSRSSIRAILTVESTTWAAHSSRPEIGAGREFPRPAPFPKPFDSRCTDRFSSCRSADFPLNFN